MCSPYTRGVYVVLQSFVEDGTPLSPPELLTKIDAYDSAADHRISHGAVRSAMADLMRDGSLEKVNGSGVRITPFGIETRDVAKSYMTRD